MFEPSEKIIVLTSSSTNWAGAKRGSLGYVKPSNSKIYLLNISKKLSICVSLLNLMLVRHGFGKERRRHESVTTINAFPIFTGPTGRGITNDVENFLSILRKQNFNSSKWLFLKSKLGNQTKLQVCVAAPVVERKISILKSTE